MKQINGRCIAFTGEVGKEAHERVLRRLFIALVMYLPLGDIAFLLGPVSFLILLAFFAFNYWLPFTLGLKLK